jgi:hypothetical protein
MTTPPFRGFDFQDQLDSVARNLTGNQFRLSRTDPDAGQKFAEFLDRGAQAFEAAGRPQAAQPTPATGLAAAQAEAERRIADPFEQQATFANRPDATGPLGLAGQALAAPFEVVAANIADATGIGPQEFRDAIEAERAVVMAQDPTNPFSRALRGLERDVFAPTTAFRQTRGDFPQIGVTQEAVDVAGNVLAGTGIAGTALDVVSPDPIDPQQEQFHIGTGELLEAFADPFNIGPIRSAGRGLLRSAPETIANVVPSARTLDRISPVGVADAAFDDVPFELPRELSRSRVNFGQRSIEFTDDFDRAVYIATSRNPSKRRKQFEDIVRSELDRRGLPSDDLTATAAPLRERVRQIAASSSGDEIIVPRGIQSDTGQVGRRRTIDELRAAGGELDFSIQVNAPGTFGDIALREVNASNVADIRRRLEALIDPQGRGLPHQGRVIATKIEREGFESLSRTERDIAQDVIVRNLEPGERLTAAELRTGAERIINEAQESLVALDDAVANAEADVIQRGIERIGANEPPPASVTRGLARAADDVLLTMCLMLQGVDLLVILRTK